MSERKVLNKYYPPDFDPLNIPRLKLAKTRQYTVRVMTPCNMKCNTCGDYIAKGKKFNARKETVEGEDYLGLHIYRFYIKCPTCMAEITFKTDPRNCDYELEHGATRNFQALRLAEMQARKEAEEAEEEEKLNPMKMLENRTEASRREMQELEDLEELKELSSRNVDTGLLTNEILRMDPKQREEELRRMRLEREKQEDEEELKNILDASESKSSAVRSTATTSGTVTRRTKWMKLEGIQEEVEVEIPNDDELEVVDDSEKLATTSIPDPQPSTSVQVHEPSTSSGIAKKQPIVVEKTEDKKRKLNGSLAGVKVVVKKKIIEPESKPSGLALLSNTYSDSDE